MRICGCRQKGQPRRQRKRYAPLGVGMLITLVSLHLATCAWMRRALLKMSVSCTASTTLVSFRMMCACNTTVGKGNMLPLELVAAYASLFVQCWDAYAVQQADGSYWRVGEPLSLSRLAAHLAGRWTLGTYLLDQESRCSFAVFDADSPDGLVRLIKLSEALRRTGISTLLEASRRGGHLWVHLAVPAPAQMVRAWLLPYAAALDVEFYPKQDVLVPGGSGSLIRL